MLTIKFTSKMMRDVKRMLKRGKDLAKLETALLLLSAQNPMPIVYRDHQLNGNLSDFRECHIEPDWLLIYQIIDEKLILSATETGTHSDLFGE